MNSRRKDLSSPWWSRWVPWSPSSRSWRKRCCRATRAGSPGEGSSPGCPCSPRWNPPACGPTCSLWVGCSRMESCRNDYPCWRNSGCDRTVDLVNGESLSLSLFGSGPHQHHPVWEAFKGPQKGRRLGEDAWAGSFNTQRVCHYVAGPKGDWNRDRKTKEDKTLYESSAQSSIRWSLTSVFFFPSCCV